MHEKIYNVEITIKKTSTWWTYLHRERHNYKKLWGKLPKRKKKAIGKVANDLYFIQYFHCFMP